MKRQLGIAQGWLIGIIALVVILAVTNAITWHVSAGYTESGWQKREAKINADAAVKIKAADDRVRDVEQAHAVQINAVDTDYQRKLKGKDDALQIALNTVAAGGKLYAHAACPAPAGNPDTKVASGAGLSNGGARAELSAADSNFLLRLGSEADSIVLQLTACQAVVRADRTP
jgi:prophage endopeptidase